MLPTWAYSKLVIKATKLILKLGHHLHHIKVHISGTSSHLTTANCLNPSLFQKVIITCALISISISHSLSHFEAPPNHGIELSITPTHSAMVDLHCHSSQFGCIHLEESEGNRSQSCPRFGCYLSSLPLQCQPPPPPNLLPDPLQLITATPQVCDPG
jgi:hypothetical protein